MDNLIANTKVKMNISAVVTRADGKKINLGDITSRFPWRLWLYRLYNKFYK